ncbi:MAG: carboxypeptidase-like regulatory domain-containing protein [Candidatus Sericytochromatia bacterium]
MTRNSIVSLALVASLALAGCGTQAAGTLTMSKVPGVGQAAPSIVTTVKHGAPERTPVAPAMPKAPAPALPAAPLAPAVPVSQIIVNGQIEMTEEMVAEDADNYGVLAVSASKVEKKFSKTGIVRQTADGYSLEASNGLFKWKKKKDTFSLTGAPEMMTLIGDRENKKALIKGTVDKAGVVTVTSVKGLANMGFLTNWFTKGKIVGRALDATTGAPIAGAEVSAQSPDGFVFKTVSEEDGGFEIKSLTPGDYSVNVKFQGYDKAEGTIEVKKLRAADLTVKLVAEPTEDESATAAAN